MPLTCTGTNGLAVISIPATSADNQALQQIVSSSLRDSRSFPVFLQLFLHRVKESTINESGNGNMHPLFGGNILMGGRTFGLQTASSLGSQARAQRLNHRFSESSLALVSGVVEHATNGRPIPNRFARSCVLPCGFQTAANLSNGTAIPPNPAKDLADHTSFLQQDL